MRRIVAIQKVQEAAVRVRRRQRSQRGFSDVRRSGAFAAILKIDARSVKYNACLRRTVSGIYDSYGYANVNRAGEDVVRDHRTLCPGRLRPSNYAQGDKPRLDRVLCIANDRNHRSDLPG